MIRFIYLLVPSVLLVGLITDLAIAQPPTGKRPRDMMSFIDRNKNNVIEPAEFDRVPGRFKETLESFGVDTSRNMTRQEFERVMPKIMEQMRSRRSSSGNDGRRRDGGGSSLSAATRSYESAPDSKQGRYGSFQNNQSSVSQTTSKSQPTNSSKSTPSKPPRTTVDLNQEFIAHDSDKDGQIGLYEWRNNNPTKLSTFFVMDLNGDGFLTPREIQLSKAGKPQRSAASFMFALTGDEKAEAKTEAKKSQAASKKTTTAATDKTTAVAKTDPLVSQATYSFKLLDRNKDQTVSTKEWKKSRSIRRMFEGANIDLTQDMSKEQFITHYVAIKKN